MVAGKFFIRPRIHPDHVVSPGAGPRHRDQIRSRHRRLPRNLVAEIDGLPDAGQKRERKQKQNLSRHAGFTGYFATGGVMEVAGGTTGAPVTLAFA